mmetsp:Transcript_98799/g.205965  ORF Transcript_98799/g.205965 Transcript_98799/m.205965 type:complete len:326 (+) Transcript_98799:48-1025(+)
MTLEIPADAPVARDGDVQKPEVVRILHISDTHGLHREIEDKFPLPEADILLHTGDFTNGCLEDELKDFDDWLGDLSARYPHRIAVCGNHEVYKGPLPQEELSDLITRRRTKNLIKNATVLDHETIEVLGLKIFGSNWCPWHTSALPGGEGDSLQGWRHELRELWRASRPSETLKDHRFDEIPEGPDILMTHGPADGILDAFEMARCPYGSSKELYAAIIRTRPRVHLHGHLHEQRGVWYRPDNSQAGPFEGGIEYQIGPDGKVHPTWGKPPEDYPCTLISCNAMLCSPKVDEMVGQSRGRYIAGPGRLIIAERSSKDASWQFRLG